MKKYAALLILITTNPIHPGIGQWFDILFGIQQEPESSFIETSTGLYFDSMKIYRKVRSDQKEAALKRKLVVPKNQTPPVVSIVPNNDLQKTADALHQLKLNSQKVSDTLKAAFNTYILKINSNNTVRLVCKPGNNSDCVAQLKPTDKICFYQHYFELLFASFKQHGISAATLQEKSIILYDLLRKILNVEQYTKSQDTFLLKASKNVIQMPDFQEYIKQNMGAPSQKVL